MDGSLSKIVLLCAVLNVIFIRKGHMRQHQSADNQNENKSRLLFAVIISAVLLIVINGGYALWVWKKAENLKK